MKRIYHVCATYQQEETGNVIYFDGLVSPAGDISTPEGYVDMKKQIANRTTGMPPFNKLTINSLCRLK